MLSMILRHGLLLAAIGVGLGVGAAFGLTRYLKSIVFGVTVNDPTTFILVPVILTLVAVLACLIPARRAARVDPIIALRCE
jgi:ABC-type antimicrobial peptide transport system permease subunit